LPATLIDAAIIKPLARHEPGVCKNPNWTGEEFGLGNNDRGAVTGISAVYGLPNGK